jgi:hypothetical protein
MMESGIRVRARTLEGIFEGLAKSAMVKNAASRASDARLRSHMESLLGTPKILELDYLKPADPNTAFALELLQAARKSRSRHTGAMFNTLITLCLINGEIIVASLLFGLLVKDWEQRSMTLTQMTSHTSSESSVESSPRVPQKCRQTYLYHISTRDLQPKPHMLKAIVLPIRERLTQATPGDANNMDFQEALQALANLAVLLNNLQIPFPQLSGFIKAVCQCPRVENWVWMMGNEGPIHIPAYRYLHRTLIELATYPPTHKPTRNTVALKPFPSEPNLVKFIKFVASHPRQNMQPPMDVNSYNTLIQYALRHRYSPGLARNIYEHMTVKREPPLPTTTDTRNIFLRAAGLYRQRDAAEPAVRFLQEFATGDVWRNVNMASPMRSELHRNLRKASTVIQVPPVTHMHQLSKDPSILATYLSTLVSCGQPHLVVKLMRVFLHIFQPRRLQQSQANQAWKESLARAIWFGPNILHTFLHALVKSGATKYSYLLFQLIVHASRASQRPTRIKENKPWRVSIVVYTTMLQAFKTEFTRRRRTGTNILPALLHKATKLYHMATSDAAKNLSAVGRLDSRFYNAILKILSLGLPIKQYDPIDVRRSLVKSRQRYARTGIVDNRGWTPLMEEVIADMISAGYPIPSGYHHLLLNDGAGLLSSSHDPPELDRRPYAFSRLKRTGTPYTLPVHNRKLLPLRRRRRIYRWRKVREITR